MSNFQHWGNVNVVGDNNNVGIVHSEDRLLQDLHITDPSYDKDRIEETKGGLLEDSYRWILENQEFKQWRDHEGSQILWIQGDPGKGKTMLLCGIINELKIQKEAQLAYFFCQATDDRLSNSTSVLRGLISMLVKRQPSLLSHARKKYKEMDRAVFEGPNAWYAVSGILTDILQDGSLRKTYLIIDALDECLNGLPELLKFVVKKSPVKWLVSSRNRPDIKERIEYASRTASHTKMLCLELNKDSVSAAVRTYIERKVSELKERKGYDEKTRKAVENHLSSNANHTFLWAALVCENLEGIDSSLTLSELDEFPPGLDEFYGEMMKRMCESKMANLYKRILAIIAVVYQPVTLQELSSLCEMPKGAANKPEFLRQIVSRCGSFLTVEKDVIYVVHQSAKDFLVDKRSNIIFPSGREDVHRDIFSRSIHVMNEGLYQNMYGILELGTSISQVKQRQPDPLAALRYPCIYWVDHLYDCSSEPSTHDNETFGREGIVDSFLRVKYLYWLEAISLCRSMSKGALSVFRLQELIKVISTKLFPKIQQMTNWNRRERPRPPQWMLFEMPAGSSCITNRQLRAVHSKHMLHFCLVQLVVL